MVFKKIPLFILTINHQSIHFLLRHQNIVLHPADSFPVKQSVYICASSSERVMKIC
jgi:hypothetical protein